LLIIENAIRKWVNIPFPDDHYINRIKKLNYD
jgi:hypothetical protein